MTEARPTLMIHANTTSFVSRGTQTPGSPYGPYHPPANAVSEYSRLTMPTSALLYGGLRVPLTQTSPSPMGHHSPAPRPAVIPVI